MPSRMKIGENSAPRPPAQGAQGAIGDKPYGAERLATSLDGIREYAIPLYGIWNWGGQGLPHLIGWLERRGFRDFAGATVIHSFAPLVALGWIWRFPATRFLGSIVGQCRDEVTEEVNDYLKAVAR